MLKYSSNPLKTHTGIHARLGQKMHIARLIAIKLHKHVIPNFDITIAIFVRTTWRTTRNMFAMIIKNFSTWTTRTCVAHHPEIIRGVTRTFVITDADNAIGRYSNLFIPNLIRFIVFGVYRNQELFLGQLKYFGQQIPSKLNSISLEIIPKREITQHLKKGVMTGCIPNII